MTAIHREILIDACIGYVRRIDGPSAHADEAQDLIDRGFLEEIETEAQLTRTSDGVIRAWCLGITESGKQFLQCHGTFGIGAWTS